MDENYRMCGNKREVVDTCREFKHAPFDVGGVGARGMVNVQSLSFLSNGQPTCEATTALGSGSFYFVFCQFG